MDHNPPYFERYTDLMEIDAAAAQWACRRGQLAQPLCQRLVAAHFLHAEEEIIDARQLGSARAGRPAGRSGQPAAAGCADAPILRHTRQALPERMGLCRDEHRPCPLRTTRKPRRRRRDAR